MCLWLGTLCQSYINGTCKRFLDTDIEANNYCHQQKLSCNILTLYKNVSTDIVLVAKLF